MNVCFRCSGAIQCGLWKEREDQPQELSPTGGAELVPEVPVESGDLAVPVLSPQLPAPLALTTTDPGLINHAYETGSDSSHSESNSSTHNKNNIKKSKSHCGTCNLNIAQICTCTVRK